MHNCPNCGSPIDPYKTKCEYCGTYCFDFSNIDFTDNKPVYIKFRFAPNYPGHEDKTAVFTPLAIPRLESIEVNNDSVDYVDIRGNTIRRMVANHTCETSVKFDCIVDPERNTLFTVEVNE